MMIHAMMTSKKKNEIICFIMTRLVTLKGTVTSSVNNKGRRIKPKRKRLKKKII